MKALLFFLIVLITACTTQQKTVSSVAPAIETTDSTEYRLIVLDPGFETWYVLKNSPALHHSKEFYRSENIQYVNAWNYNTSSSGHSDLFGERIEYDPRENYPFEIEHKLYYYFQYVEKELKIPILHSRSRGVP